MFNVTWAYIRDLGFCNVQRDLGFYDKCST